MNKLQNLERISKLMDNQFKIFGFRFGLDPIIGLVPGAGDFIAPMISLYIVVQGLKLGVPQSKLPQMLWNIILDAIVGVIPLVGDIFDFGFKANAKNIRIIREHIGVITETQ